MDNIATLFATAVHYHQNGQHDQAEPLYVRILQQDKSHLGSLVNLGILYRLRGDLDAAILLHKKAIFLDPDDLINNYQLAKTLKLKGLLDEALKHYNRALAIQPFDTNLLFETADILFNCDRIDEAIFLLKNARKINPNLISAYLLLYLLLGNAFTVQGKFEAAKQSYEEASRILPNFAEAYNGIGMVFLRQGKLSEALVNFNRAWELDSSNKKTQKWFSFVQKLVSGFNEVSFTYQGVPIEFALSGKNIDVELAHAAGEFYEVMELEFSRQYLDSESVVVDVGCNTGNHLVYFAKVAKVGKVIPIEFHPRAIELLKKNISLNQIANIDLSKLGYAVACSRGKAILKEHPARDLCLTEVCAAEDGDIEILPLDELIAEKVHLIKIDVQSLELEVLEGAKRIIADSKPDLLVEVMQVNQVPFQTFLKKMGYAVVGKVEYANYTNFYARPIP